MNKAEELADINKRIDELTKVLTTEYLTDGPYTEKQLIKLEARKRGLIKELREG